MVGVLLGDASGGLLAVDHDGESASDLLRTKFNIQRLPTTPTITSGKPGRFCSFYRVPASMCASLKQISFETGVKGPDGKDEALELRWTGQQIVAGIHPETGNKYQWLIHPKQCDLADAPEVLLRAMRKAPEPEAPLLEQRPKENNKPTSIDDDVPLEKLLARDHRDLLAKGCSEGGRNNAGYKLAADLIGVAAWCKAEGVRYSGYPTVLFLDFCARCSPPLSKREARTIYESAEQNAPGPCLSEDKLRVCARGPWET